MSVRFDVEVSLAFGADITADPSTWSWTDITSYAMVREGGVTIRRGRSDWQASAQPATCNVLLNNNDGRFSRLYPLGTYYGQLKKNTPLRVRARETGGSYSTRFVGYVSEWPTEWDPSESNYWVGVEANGVLRRIGLGSKPAKSLTTGNVQSSSADIVGYWPLEDSAGATQAASGLVSGGTPLAVSGTVGFESVSPPAGSLSLPNVSAGRLNGICKTTATITSWTVELYVMCSGTCDVLTWTTSSGFSFTLSISTTAVTVTPSTGSAASFSANYANSAWRYIAVFADASGSSFNLTVSGDTSDSSSPSLISGTPGQVVSVVLNPGTSSNLSSMGHLIAKAGAASASSYLIMNGLAGRRASNLFELVAAFNSVAVDTPADETTTELMGAFPSGGVVDAFRECVDADEGVMTERRTGELGFDSHQSRENLSVVLALDYALGHISTPFSPTDDDRLTRNDVTVNRINGSSSRVVETIGAMGTNPTTGAGRYDESVSRNLYTDDQPYHHAGWRVNVGTVDDLRYPVVNLRLHRSSDLVSAWKSSDVGSRVTIDNLPAQLPPELVDQIIEGYTERINRYEWDVSLNLSPYRPYKVFVVADWVADAGAFVGRLAGDANAAIRSAITSSGTSIDIDPNWYRWTTLLIKDTFTRSVSSSWGSPDLGIAWALDVGTAADFSVNGSVGIMSHPSAGVNHSQIIFTGPDSDSVIHFNLPAAPVGVGGQVIVVVRPRWTDANNHYEVRATVNTGGSITTEMRKRVAGSPTTIASGPNFTLSTSAWYALRISTVGTTIRAKIWDTSGTEPDWQLATTDTSLTTGNFISVLSVTTSITNLPYTVNFDNFQVSGATGQPDDFNPLLPVRFGGETATIKGISTTAVTFVAAGAASHADNAAVTPAIYAGSTALDGIFLVGRIRGTAGTLATPAGYTLLKKVGGLYLWMKPHSGSESNPTVTPSGGSAGDTVSAFTFGFRGTPSTLADLTSAIVDSSSVSNASAQNITYYGIYPWQQEGCVLLVIAGKSDDWTSAAITGWTEIAEPTTLTGNDQSLYAAYQIQTAPLVANEGTITVTGGASAVSEAMTLAIAAGYQTLTVDTRSTNGVVKSHAANTKIEVDTYVMGL